MVIHGGSHQVQAVAFIEVDGDTFNIESYVVIALAVEAQDIAHTRASTATYTDAEAKAFRDAFCLYDLLDFLGGTR